jgi:hypothetical protein
VPPFQSRPLVRLDYALIVGVMLLAIAARALPGPRTIDDAFITFRYSRNIIEGQGFVYNPGSRVLGTTTPLFTVLMAALAVLFGGQDFPWYAIAVSALADAGTAALLCLLARRLTGSRWMGALLGALWAIAPRSVTFAVGGMETSVNIFWMIGAVWLYVIGRDGWMGVFAALGVLTRVDAVIWIGPLFLFQWVEKWRSLPHPLTPPMSTSVPQAERGNLLTPDSPLNQRGEGPRVRRILSLIPWRTWLAFGVTITPWLIFSLAYFGSPFPRSLTAKAVAYIMPPGSALVTFIQNYSTPFFEFDTFGSIGAAVGSLVYLALSLLGITYAARRLPRLLPILIYPWLYMAVFSAANPLIFRWYTAPPTPGLMLGIVGGAWLIIENLRRATRQPVTIPVAIGALAILWGGMSLHAWRLHPDHAPDRPAPEMAWHKIELLYQQIGTELREKYGVTPETRVGSADIGAVGYFSRATIVDTVGLVTPALSKYYPVSPTLIVPGQNYAIPPQLIDETQPAFLVTMEAFVRLGLEEDDAFKQHYTLLEEIPTDFYGTGMRLYKRH